MGQFTQEKTNQKITLLTVMTEKQMISGALGKIAVKCSRAEGEGCLFVFAFSSIYPWSLQLPPSLTKFQVVVSTLARGHKDAKVDCWDE